MIKKLGAASVLLLIVSACATRPGPPPPSAPAARAAPPESLAALAPAAEDLYVRVVDVGPGLCTVTKAPGGHSMVYDAGHWVGDKCIEAVREIVGGDRIDLLVISHGDADHLADAAKILKEFRVAQVIRTGLVRDSGAWKRTNRAIGDEAADDGASVTNLQTVDLRRGDVIALGEAKVTLVAGWGQSPFHLESLPEERNVISIVVRLEYRGRSVLFTGDTIGRRLGDDAAACKDAEQFMVDHAAAVPIDSDVLIAPHHGGDNGSSQCFVDAVSPDYVVFSAGHEHQHPTQAAAERYLAAGVPLEHLFRTDRGDDESGLYEWREGRVPGCEDRNGDDDVDVVLRGDGTVEVDYRCGQTAPQCRCG